MLKPAFPAGVATVCLSAELGPSSWHGCDVHAPPTAPPSDTPAASVPRGAPAFSWCIISCLCNDDQYTVAGDSCAWTGSGHDELDRGSEGVVITPGQGVVITPVELVMPTTRPCARISCHSVVPVCPSTGSDSEAELWLNDGPPSLHRRAPAEPLPCGYTSKDGAWLRSALHLVQAHLLSRQVSPIGPL
jgi:hypothetical protein